MTIMTTTLHPIVAQLRPSEEQLPAVTLRGEDIVVTAGAGAGKTRTLVARYLSLLAGGLSPRHIAAITFTRKAAREMRNRVRASIATYLRDETLNPQERNYWEEIYTQLDAARIGTIHSLCTELLRAHPAEAGIDPRFAMLEEADSTILKNHAVEEALAMAADDPLLVRLFQLFGERGLRDIVETLLNNRLEAERLFQNLPDDLLSSWEERLRRQQLASLQRLLAQASWQDAVAELRANVAAIGDDALEQERQATLSAIATAEAATGYSQQRHVLSRLDSINLARGSQKAWPGGKEQQAKVKEALKTLRTLWRAEKGFLELDLNEADQVLAEAIPLLRAMFQYAASRYVQSKDARQSLDFDDLEQRALALLQDETVCRRWQNEISALLVDEYQDTNGRQRDLINSLNGTGGKLFIVGDAKQSIYRFRGADVTVFRAERKRIEQSGRTVTLTTSYRAHAPLMEALNALMQPVLGVADIEEQPWREPFSPLRHHRQQPAHNVQAPYVELHLGIGSKSSGGLQLAANALARRIRTLVDQTDIRFGDIAILCRASRSFTPYEDALDALGIPYLTVAGRGFYERPEVRDLLNALQALADPTDDLALVGLLRSPVSGLSDVQLYHLWRRQQEEGHQTLWEAICALDEEEQPWLTPTIKQLHESAGRTGIADLLKAFLDATDYRAALRLAGQHRALRNVSKLLELAQAANAGGGIVAVDDFLEYISTVRSAAGREGEARSTAENAVQIMTVHQAKGLEFPIVVLGDANSGSTKSPTVVLDEHLGLMVKPATCEEAPAIFKAAQEREKAMDEAEADRLLYVAATRARDKLLVNGVLSLKKDGQPGKLDGWLRELAVPCRLHEQTIPGDEEGDQAHQLALQVGETAVHCTIYEPRYHLPAAPTTVEERAAEIAGAWSPQLIAEVKARRERWEDDILLPVRRVSGREDAGAIPPYLIGALTHEALATWRFPAEDGAEEESTPFRSWFEGRARQFGLLAASELSAARQQVEAALQQFRQHSLFAQVNAAEQRLHEVPYLLQDEERFEQGRIDLLFRHNGQWTLVEFKTDTTANPEQLVERYRGQIQRYARAVRRLLGESPRCVLCILNHVDKSCTVQPI